MNYFGTIMLLLFVLFMARVYVEHPSVAPETFAREGLEVFWKIFKGKLIAISTEFSAINELFTGFFDDLVLSRNLTETIIMMFVNLFGFLLVRVFFEMYMTVIN